MEPQRRHERREQTGLSFSALSVSPRLPRHSRTSHAPFAVLNFFLSLTSAPVSNPTVPGVGRRYNLTESVEK